jgi:hypothetical protein
MLDIRAVEPLRWAQALAHDWQVIVAVSAAG